MHAEWHQLGQPVRDRFGLTVERDGTHAAWLDLPTNPNQLRLN
ncbi:MAG: hypothetical protein ACRDQ7_20200 [Haloechinothrix sp.]